MNRDSNELVPDFACIIYRLPVSPDGGFRSPSPSPENRVTILLDHLLQHLGRFLSSMVDLVLRLVLFKTMAFASAVLAAEWNPGHPDHYQVVEGDTLWSVAGRFLNRPWEWPEVWRGNPQIQNPNLIYPGDVIVFEAQGGRQPYLRLDAGVEDRRGPRIRATPLEAAIPVIPLKAVSPFLTHPRVIEVGTLESLPYVVDLAEEHVLGGPGDRVYVRALYKSSPVDYTVFRPGDVYRDPDTHAVLGHEAVFIAEGYLEQTGDPATLMLTRAEKETRPGDRLLPTGTVGIGDGYIPRPAPKGVVGHIIGVMDGVTQIGQFSVVALDRGSANRVEIGHVFEIWQKGAAIRDTVGPRFGEKIVGPEQKAGVLMVFLAYRRVSFGLVMKAERFIHVLDTIRAP